MTELAEGASSSGLGPVGTVLGPGSTNLHLTPREEQIACLVARGRRYKNIAHDLGISTTNVAVHVARIAHRIPGEGSPLQKVSAWVWTYGTSADGP